MDERCCGHGNAKEMKTETWRKDKQTKNNKSTCTNSMADTSQRGSGEEEDIGKASETKLGRLGRAQMLKWVLNSFYWTVILWDGGRKLKQYGSDWLQCAVALRLEYFVLKRASIVFDSFFLIQNRKTHKCNWTNIGLFKSNARRPFFFLFTFLFRTKKARGFWIYSHRFASRRSTHSSLSCRKSCEMEPLRKHGKRMTVQCSCIEPKSYCNRTKRRWKLW